MFDKFNARLVLLPPSINIRIADGFDEGGFFGGDKGSDQNITNINNKIRVKTL